jgi:RNA polymerase sigma-70 factor (ECF subfamily)
MNDAADDWTVWLNQHGASLVLFARQWVPSRADAEDVVQEAFVHFWRSRHRVLDPVAYLYASVKHCAHDWLRGRQRRVRREKAAAREEAVDHESLFAGSVEAEDRRSMIEAAVRRLPDAQREVLVMKAWGGLSFPQIATALKISANTAASRYRYALAKLREELAEESIP